MVGERRNRLLPIAVRGMFCQPNCHAWVGSDAGKDKRRQGEEADEEEGNVQAQRDSKRDSVHGKDLCQASKQLNGGWYSPRYLVVKRGCVAQVALFCVFLQIGFSPIPTLKVYYNPLKDILDMWTIKNIFSNIEIIRNYQQLFLSQLEERMAKWYSQGQRLGDIFLQVVSGPER